MYSPYLYARATELLALRALVENGVNLDSLVPIIEPVVINSGNVVRCMKVLGEAGARLIVAINPAQHEFHENVQAQVDFRAATQSLFQKYPTLIPGYIVSPHSTKSEIEKFYSSYSGRSVALLYNSSPLNTPDFKSVIESDNVIFHVVINNKISSAQLSMLPKNKLVEITDNFNKLKKNADYDGAEFFTDRHLQIGKAFAAMGDYTITGRELDIGGGKPGAVAIHATYKNNNEVWVEHFVSDETDREVGDASSKFLEAARKLVKELDARPREFGSDAALDAYRAHVASETFSGLPKNKQYQIYHHICLMLSVVGLPT